MCDTMVALSSATRCKRVLFAKNSDRQPNEPHVLIRVPRRHYEPGTALECTYITIEQAEETYGVFLLKPSWIWGCEMGGNEFGLNIGNEAVFTREKYEESALTGMDMVRLALERCRTAQEAVHFIISLLDKYGQGGNCGYEKDFTYHNSFLIADLDSAWVLETAGQYWAAERVQGVRSISNSLSIGKSFDLAHPELITHAIEKGWCKSEQDFDFARCYSDPLYTFFSGSKIRRQSTQSQLERNQGNIDIEVMKSILRSHHSSIEGRQFACASLKSVCMHGGGPIGDHTTGSYIVSMAEPQIYWVTGSSTPCLSVYKPISMNTAEGIIFAEEDIHAAVEFWNKRELIHRMVLAKQVPDLKSYLMERDRLEESWQQMIQEVMEEDGGGPDQESRLKGIEELAWREEESLVTRIINDNKDNLPRWGGNPFFRRYWRKQTSGGNVRRYKPESHNNWSD
ncbi:MAG: peptidase U34 [Syntrophomonadaceae bacterium]|nr:peptidase U34 [Syntrophomonadaceae bacterium]